MIYQKGVTPAEFYRHVEANKKNPSESWSDFKEMTLCSECDHLQDAGKFCIKCGGDDVELVRAKIKTERISLGNCILNSKTDRVIRRNK